MPDADEREGPRRLAALFFPELSRHDLTSSSCPQPRADLPPLLRCCLLLLPLVDGVLAVRCARRLLAFARGILSRDPDRSLLLAIELFAENLVVSGELRSLFAEADAIPNGSRVSIVAPSCLAGHRLLLQLMAHHFLSSVQDEMGFEQFFGTLSWLGKDIQESPEIGLLGAISLVNRCRLFSIPTTVQAHLLLLASRCVGNGDLDQHLLVFRYAMDAYLRYLPALGVFTRTSGVTSPFNCFAKEGPFKSCMEAAVYQKLGCQINRLLSFCKSHSDDGLLTNEKDIFDTSVRFIEENQHFIYEQFRQETVFAIKSVVSDILGCAKQKEMHELDGIVPEEIICLAAVIRLMGTCFLRILQCIGQMMGADGGGNENYLSFGKQCNFISETIRLLGQYEADEAHRHNLFGIIGMPVDKGRASMLTLTHFASLATACLTMRFGFLWKGCIIMMMAAMNLVIAEEGTLGVFHCFDGSQNSVISSMDEGSGTKVSVRRKSSTVIALRYKNLHKVWVQDEVMHDFGEGSSFGNLERCKSIDGRGDARAFFRCLPGYNSSEWDGLTDFVECKPSMDYASWWIQKKKFKQFRDEKFYKFKYKDEKRKCRRLGVKGIEHKIHRGILSEKLNRCKRLGANKKRTQKTSKTRLR